MNVRKGKYSLMNYIIDKDEVTGIVAGRYNFVLDFNYDIKNNAGEFYIGPIIELDGVKYLLYCSLCGKQIIDDSSDLEDFLQLIMNIADYADMYHDETTGTVSIYWNATKIGMKIYPEEDGSFIKIELIPNSEYAVILDIRHTEILITEDGMCQTVLNADLLNGESTERAQIKIRPLFRIYQEDYNN